jgi:hypothetical protein
MTIRANWQEKQPGVVAQFNEMSRRLINAADYLSIQAALDALPNDGGDLIIPSGTYNISNLNLTGKNYVHIIGEGKPYLWITGEGDGFFIDNCLNFSMENIRIDGEHNNLGYGLHIKDSYRNALKNVHVKGASKHQIFLDQSWTFSSYDCFFDASGAGDGIAGYYQGLNGNAVTHNHSIFMADEGGCGALIDDGAAISFIGGCDFHGPRVNTSSVGIKIDGCWGLKIDGAYFEDCGLAAIYIGSGDKMPVGVSIRDSYISQNRLINNVGIYANKVHTLTIDGNTLLGDGTDGSTGVIIGDVQSFGVKPSAESILAKNYIYQVSNNVLVLS